MLTLILISFIASYFFLFLFWYRLRDDYMRHQIFTTGFYTLTGLLCGIALAFYIKPEFWFWTGLASSLAGLGIGIYRFKLRLLEVFEAYEIGMLFLLQCAFFYHAINQKNILSLFGVAVILVLFILFIFFHKRYKRIQWYRSGKVGFAGIVIAGLFFLIRAVIALTPLPMLSLGGALDAILSAFLAFLFFLRLFTLAREKI